ncbi:hypothetical protein F5H01DRAFT_129922 [Linnemannia elongata]|nr:hypothetical protein F5H01DRAFT_129922 [Linnemannia elongata]
MPYPSKTHPSSNRRCPTSSSTSSSWKLTSLLLLGLACLSLSSTTATKAPTQLQSQRNNPESPAAARHDPFNGLFNPRPDTPHLLGLPNGSEQTKSKRPAKMVKVPYFIEHLIRPQQPLKESTGTSSTTTTVTRTVATAATASTTTTTTTMTGGSLEHDHSTHKPGQCRVSN